MYLDMISRDVTDTHKVMRLPFVGLISAIEGSRYSALVDSTRHKERNASVRLSLVSAGGQEIYIYIIFLK